MIFLIVSFLHARDLKEKSAKTSRKEEKATAASNLKKLVFLSLSLSRFLPTRRCDVAISFFFFFFQFRVFFFAQNLVKCTVTGDSLEHQMLHSKARDNKRSL